MAQVSSLSPLLQAKYHSLKAFVIEECIPAETIFEDQLSTQQNRWGSVPVVIEDLKSRAKQLGLWNLFVAEEFGGISNVEYAPFCELMGRSFLAPEACNCSAPDTGNMEVLLKYGTEEQKKKWLYPLMDGSIRSAFLMTEPAVASSDARNICTSIKRDGDNYIINGRKWWSTGAMDPRCALAIVSK